MSQTDSIEVTARVAVDPQFAFDVFTKETDLWWKRGPRFRAGGDRPSEMQLETGPGGRLLERYADAEGGEFVLGRVVVWEPPSRLVLELGGRDFGPDDGWIELEVRFEAEGAGTRVTVVNRGYDALPDDHPVFHGGGRGEAFLSAMGLWAADLLAAFARRTGER